jgi:hypothetical protein
MFFKENVIAQIPGMWFTVIVDSRKSRRFEMRLRRPGWSANGMRIPEPIVESL